MSEPTPEPTPTPEPEPTPDPPAQEPDWKAEARKWEQRSKENKSALDELTEKFQTVSSERDDFAGKVQAFEQEKERASLISEIAKEKKVPASALRGNTREELEAHADTLAELIKPSGPVVPWQEKTPETVPPSEDRQFVGKLFGGKD